jgi:two-component sensor histidine kinase
VEDVLKAALHPHQAARLRALRQYDILDTPPEADFDAIVEVASAICGTPISVVNLIDMERQWFKAEVGLGVRETPLDTSLCAHAILEDDFVEIEDTLLDRRMKDNALCISETGLRFYAGALLKTPDGLPLGTLCVLDYVPRCLSPEQRRTLQLLARQVMTLLDLRLALKQQALLAQEIDHRVKNSLQSVSALVRLQRRKSDDVQVRAALDQVAERIETVSLLHEELYRIGGAGIVDLGAYLGRIAELLQRNAHEAVRIEIDADPVLGDVRLASPLGMIVSEFAANALKHAFAPDVAGTVTFTLRANGESAILDCRDDGPTTFDMADPALKRGLGLRIIAASASQIGGVLTQMPTTHGLHQRLAFTL